jgi:hypothetical protein
MQWTIRLEVKTGGGEVESLALTTLTRPAGMTAAAEVGLSLAEGKVLLARLQAAMVRRQLAEHVALGRVCPGCQAVQQIKDRRARRLQTLFGTLELEAPRLKACPCRGAVGTPGATVSPVCDLLQDARCTPELERVQAELGARTAFRKAARILTALLPVGAANHASVRNRTHAVGQRLEVAEPPVAEPLGRVEKTWGYAAARRSGSWSRPSRTAARTWSRRCAPTGDQRICRRLFMRALTS